MTVPVREIKKGDTVIVRCWGCEMNGQVGIVVAVSQYPDEQDMPITVQSCTDLREWPFHPDELEKIG